MENASVTRKQNILILILIELIVLIFIGITSLPALIVSLLFVCIFMKINVNKMIFTIGGMVLGILVNLKISFYKYFLYGAVNIIKILIKNAIHKNDVSKIFMDYSFNLNIVWQIIIAFIVGSIFASIIEYILNKDVRNEDIIKEKRVSKKLKSLKDLKHLSSTTILGIDYDTLERVDISDNAKHIIVAGTTGSGKTVTISNYIESAMQKNYPVLAIDGKGDLDKGSLLHYMQDLSEKYNRKLYVINFVKPEFSDHYNPFFGANITVAKDMLISMSDWSEPHYKINTERYLQQLIRILNKRNIPLSLNTIIEYSPQRFTELIEEMKDNQELSIKEFEKLSEIINFTSDIVYSAMARFATTAESEAGEIFNGQGIDIYKVMKEKANILIILDSLGKPELSKQVGRLAILDAKKAVSKLFGDSQRKFFIFDEFNVYASDVAVDLLNKSRSAAVTCIPAFQSLSDLDKAGGAALRNQVIENCNNYIIMRQNSPDSSTEWERVIGEIEVTKYTYAIENETGILFDGSRQSGNGSMHKDFESKYRATEIQRLKTGQCIFVSKDQGIEKKLGVRSINLDMKKPILIKSKDEEKNEEIVQEAQEIQVEKKEEEFTEIIEEIEFPTEDTNDEKIENNEFSEIEEILKDDEEM